MTAPFRTPTMSRSRPFVVLVDLCRELGDALLDLFLGVENVLEVCLDVG
jgi:hypothetical protein